MDGLILAKRHDLIELDDGYALCLPTAEVHLDAPLCLVVEGQLLIPLQVTLASKFPIDPVENIVVERRSDTLGIVVGREQDRWRFFQVHPQEKDIIRAEDSGHTLEELDALCWREVPQTGAEKGHGFPLQLKRLNDLRLPRKIGMHGMDLGVGVFLQQTVSCVPEGGSGNVYRTVAKRLPGPFISCKQMTGLG